MLRMFERGLTPQTAGSRGVRRSAGNVRTGAANHLRRAPVALWRQLCARRPLSPYRRRTPTSARATPRAAMLGRALDRQATLRNCGHARFVSPVASGLEQYIERCSTRLNRASGGATTSWKSWPARAAAWVAVASRSPSTRSSRASACLRCSTRLDGADVLRYSAREPRHRGALRETL